MEKSLAATTEMVSDHICDDAALVILSKLPLKSLFRFCCVRKSWSQLFENPYFMNMFRRNFLSNDRSYYNDTSLLLHLVVPWHVNYKYEPALYSLSGERFDNKVRLDWPNPFDEQYNFNIYGSASVNGILCIEGAGRVGGINYMEEVGRVVLWNPATNEFKVIPPSSFAFESPCWDPVIRLHGFGYDKVRDDYKVIRHVSFYPRTDEDENETWKDGQHYPLWEMYCLKSNSWRKLDLDMPPQYNIVGVQVYTDGVCHWWGESDTHDDVYLVSFNLSNEKIVITSISSNMDGIDIDIDTRLVFRHLDMLNGSIGWISNYAEANTFHISVLGEVGVKESWIKLFIVGPLSCVEHPIGVGMKGYIFFRKKNNELVWYNLSTQRIEELGVKGAQFRCRIMVYKKSLLPIERINN